MAIKGAGGTPGGAGSFFLGLIMMLAGGYLFLSSVRVFHILNFGYGLFHLGGFRVTTGTALFPLIFGIGIIFFNAKSLIGWLLALAGIVAIVAGVIASIQLSLMGMSLFDLLVIIVLGVGGLGLFLKSLRSA